MEVGRFTCCIKLHTHIQTAPGSQNGFDNSGKAGGINWQSGDNVPNTLTAIQNLANRYRNDQDVVTAIQLLNEPANWGNDLGLLKKFYYDGWGNVRTTSANTAVVIHDAFLDPQSWNGFMGYGSGVNDVILDTHIYQIFSQGEVAMKPCQHVQTACASAGRISKSFPQFALVQRQSNRSRMRLISIKLGFYIVCEIGFIDC